ncbi:transglycosylase family protein [Streptomyces sp. SID3212]|uniref:LysM peptidoglycan-binding domain-containing protein n=1 Tax=Streptomyces sp. SID3212 TaxID=2690259 RepID=UPI00136BED29|nr:transglycosylase family protein [Streptomyces sp. SID3212]MYV55945.1 LysM peptidoglycan-binding domain-containing protein [Streptomyces sp. SID3212]
MSANGRHRRPRQAPALIVAAGVTGSAIAIPLLGATSASAADASTWDRVADCESGGAWSADLGNGFFGGLQIAQETWDDFGGGDYATRPDLASRSQQIAVAEKVLDAQGPSAWASCAPVAGLLKNTAEPLVDPGAAPGTVEESASPEASTGPGGASDTDRAEGSDTTPSSPDSAPSASSTPSGSAKSAGGERDGGDGTESGATDTGTPSPSRSATPSSRATTDTVKGKHRGGAAPEDSATPGATGLTPDNSGEERESGRHASRGDGLTRDAEGVKADVAGTPDGEYVVRPGDCLWRIADENGVEGGWSALYEANKDALGSDPDLILPGQTVDLGVK